MQASRNLVTGIHHITAIAGEARGNLAFYREVLGLRFIKKTVNFDDPRTYHLYFGDRIGTPGTVYTSFPWSNSPMGLRGTGEVGATAYTVPRGTLPTWQARLEKRGIAVQEGGKRFGDTVVAFADDGGGTVELVESDRMLMGVQPWLKDGASADLAIRGFHTPTLVVRDAGPTRRVLVDGLGFREVGVESGRIRLAVGPGGPGRQVDLVEQNALAARPGTGSVHHIAFRVPDDGAQAAERSVLVAAGLNVTEVRDRSYFQSVYFREPGGILLEIATDRPGFTVDENEKDLGRSLKLPPQYEPHRARIELALPRLE